MRKGDLITAKQTEPASHYYLVESSSSETGKIIISAALISGRTAPAQSNCSITALASNFRIVYTKVELRRMSGHTETTRFDDIVYDERENEFWTQICATCNTRLQLGASDEGAHQDLICGVRGCHGEADFYLDLDLVSCDRCRNDCERNQSADENITLCENCTGENK